MAATVIMAGVAILSVLTSKSFFLEQWSHAVSPIFLFHVWLWALISSLFSSLISYKSLVSWVSSVSSSSGAQDLFMGLADADWMFTWWLPPDPDSFSCSSLLMGVMVSLWDWPILPHHIPGDTMHWPGPLDNVLWAPGQMCPLCICCWVSSPSVVQPLQHGQS